MKNLLKRLWQEEEGQDLVEYGLLLFLGRSGRHRFHEGFGEFNQHCIWQRCNQLDHRRQLGRLVGNTGLGSGTAGILPKDGV